MIKLSWQRRLKLVFWKNIRAVTFCSTAIFAILLYTKFFVLQNGREAELMLVISFLIPLFGIALGFFITVLVLLLVD